MTKITKYRVCITYYNQQMETIEWKECNMTPLYMKEFARFVAKKAVSELEDALGQYDIGLRREFTKVIVQFNNGQEISVLVEGNPKPDYLSEIIEVLNSADCK